MGKSLSTVSAAAASERHCAHDPPTDIETRRTILRVNAHKDDVNAVAFADIASSNLLLSGSDDKSVAVAATWRSMADTRSQVRQGLGSTITLG